MKPHNNILYNINKLLNVSIADGMDYRCLDNEHQKSSLYVHNPHTKIIIQSRRLFLGYFDPIHTI